MTQGEAITRARAFVSEHVGVDADPASARLMERAGKPPYWSIVYMPDVLHPEEADRGVTIDGPYVLHVDDATGEVSVLG
jgi:hypothetical protein